MALFDLSAPHSRTREPRARRAPREGAAGYNVDFLQYWVHKILYFNAPAWVFALAYTIFAALVVLVWLFGDRLQNWRRAYKN